MPLQGLGTRGNIAVAFYNNNQTSRTIVRKG